MNQVAAASTISVNQLVFPLLKLPVDLINRICLFLCEKTIGTFEFCCRYFYQLTNTASFISKSGNFKEMKIYAGNIGRSKCCLLA